MSAAPSAAPAPATATEMGPADMGRLVALAVALGIGGALVGSVFLAIMSFGQNLIWKDIPGGLPITAQDWWYVLIWMVVAAAVVAVAQRLPGHTGGSPIEGLHFNVGPKQIGGVALAALATLILAIPLGPEAPLIACGTALGGYFARNAKAEARQLAMLLGGAAAIGAVLGNPFITAVLFLEFAALGVLPVAALVPVYISLAAGYLVMTGLGGFSGLGTHTLSVAGLPPLDRLPWLSIAFAIVAAVVAAVLTLLARAIGWQTWRVAQRRPVPTLFVAAILIGTVGIVITHFSGLSIETVLFDGEGGIPELIGATSFTAVLLATVGRLIVYGLALGAGFRGGPIFPSVAMGVGVGAAMALLIDPSLQTPLIVAGIAACIAASLKVTFTAGLLALLITSTAGAVTAPVAIVGAIVGYLVRIAHDRKWPPPVPSAVDTAAAARAASDATPAEDSGTDEGDAPDGGTDDRSTDDGGTDSDSEPKRC